LLGYGYDEPLPAHGTRQFDRRLMFHPPHLQAFAPYRAHSMVAHEAHAALDASRVDA
jgi:hypothetical protein